jgi:hypothetical protein
MSGLLSPAVTGNVMDFDPYNTDSSTSAAHQYGSLVETNHGRDNFRFGKAGAVATSKGKLAVCPAPIANHQGQTLTAASQIAIGTKQLTCTNGGTASPVGIYDQGSISLTSGTGLGQTFPVLHSYVAGTSAAIVVDLDGQLAVAAVAGTTTYTLTHNPYNAFVEAAVKTRTACGIGLRDSAIGGWAFLQTKGVVGALIGSAATLGGRLTSDGSTAGAVTDNTDVTTVQTEVEIGQASIVAGTTGRYDPIVLSID